jgi:hypothetical protein
VGGVLLTSFFFGAMHLDPPQAMGAAVLGIGLHLAYLATRSLWVPMLLHFLNNSLAVVALTQSNTVLDAFDKAPANTPWLIVLLLYVSAVALVVTVGWALYQSRARVEPVEGAEHPWCPAYPGVEYPPRGSGSVVVSRRPSAAAMILVAMTFGLFICTLTAG